MKAEQTSDEDLLRAFARGRKAALAELARRYERPLLGFAHGLLRGGDDRVACDVVQETWLRVIRYADSFDGRSGFKTWLYRIAINQCRSVWSARPEPVSSEAVTARADPGAGPDRQAQDGELADHVRLAVAQLPPEQRLVVLLCYHSNMRHEQAAEILEIPLGTLKSRLHAALRELRERLSAETKP
ncbi:MAG: sigma-70 family RNA polymerase sigma factor [Planctomycetes bacterium]|nr:sigma-70 family RNA polymerase sigma factor [Planctomycetota bacterium]